MILDLRRAGEKARAHKSIRARCAYSYVIHNLNGNAALVYDVTGSICEVLVFDCSSLYFENTANSLIRK
jgi:hypothetical protein